MTILSDFKDLFKSDFQLFKPSLIGRVAVLIDRKQDITRSHPVKTKSRANLEKINIA